LPPLKLLIEHKDAVQNKSRKSDPDLFKPDWKIYVSDKTLEPTDINNQYAFIN